MSLLDAEELLEQGKLSVQQDDYEGALACFDAAVELEPTLIDAYLARSFLYIQLAQFELAIVDLSRVIDRGDEDFSDFDLAMLYCSRGHAYRNLSDFQRAITDFNQVLRLDPTCAEAYCELGLVYLAQGQSDLAFAGFNEAIRLDCDHGPAHCNRGLLYANWGKLEPAIADFNRALDIDPNDLSARINRGSIYVHSGKTEKALADFEAAIQINPEAPAGYSGRGSVYLASGEYKLALADYTEAIHLNPAQAEYYFNRGIVHAERGDYTHALNDFEQALKQDRGLANRLEPWVSKIMKAFEPDSRPVIPFDEATIYILVELTRRSSLILTGLARGSQSQAWEFDNWLEQYRYKHPAGEMAFLAMSVEFQDAPVASTKLPTIGTITWWKIDDQHDRFACAFGTTSQYRVPHLAPDIPNITEFYE